MKQIGFVNSQLITASDKIAMQKSVNTPSLTREQSADRRFTIKPISMDSEIVMKQRLIDNKSTMPKQQGPQERPVVIDDLILEICEGNLVNDIAARLAFQSIYSAIMTALTPALICRNKFYFKKEQMLCFRRLSIILEKHPNIRDSPIDCGNIINSVINAYVNILSLLYHNVETVEEKNELIKDAKKFRNLIKNTGFFMILSKILCDDTAT